MVTFTGCTILLVPQRIQTFDTTAFISSYSHM